jgi:SAM-dependent methyltransferase
VRPGYPPDLLDALVPDGPLSVLDVGCGTGISSRLLAARGCRVLGVEPDARMGAVARRHGVSVELGTFEEWDPASRTFDLVAAGQAWHWVDPVLGPRKAARVLGPGGRLGVFWNVGILPVGLKEEIGAAYAAQDLCLDPYSVLLGSGGDDRLHATVRSLEACPDLSAVAVRSFDHERAYTTESWLDQLPTHSDHRVQDPARLAGLLAAVAAVIDRAGGRFVMRYRTYMVQAESRRPERAASMGRSER